MDPTETAFNADADICQQLLDRYSASSAAHHRHLCATAAAMRSILLEDSLSLSNLSYFAASMSAVSKPSNDAVSLAALSAFLSILLPLIPEGSISPEKAAEAVEILARVLDRGGEDVSSSSVKCVVKCVGVLVGYRDLKDWESVKLPFEVLLKFSIDKRPKVRKSALVYLEKTVRSFQSPAVRKQVGKMVLSLLKSHMPLAVKTGATGAMDGTERSCATDRSDVVHILNVVKFAVPYLSSKVSVKVVLKLLKLLDSKSPTLTSHIFSTVEAFFENFELGVVVQVAEDVILAIKSYISSKENPKDTTVSAAYLVKIALDKLKAGERGKWTDNLPLSINSLAGLLMLDDDIASQASNILKGLIDHHIHPVDEGVPNNIESDAIASVCSVFENLLDSCDGIPNDHILAVLSVLFLKLDYSTYFYMKGIIFKLAESVKSAQVNMSDPSCFQKCFGCGVVAMGPENVLKLLPIAVDMESLTCSNTWLLPILKKFIVGASLRYFLEHIVPLAKSLQKASRGVKKSVTGQDLQAHGRAMWGLLPAFCRSPADTSENFEPLSKLMLVQLEDSSMHEDIALALQELVRENKCVLKKTNEAAGEHIRPSDNSSLEDSLLGTRSLCRYNKKTASRNLKALSSHSGELLQILTGVFLDSPLEKRLLLKDAIKCLASVSASSATKDIFISSIRRLNLTKGLTEAGELSVINASADDSSSDPSSEMNDSRRCLILELASVVASGADEDLVDIIYRFTKPILQEGDGICVCEAHNTINQILQDHTWFCSSHFDELINLLTGLKSPADSASLRSRLATLHILLVHSLKNTESDDDNTKAFLILNEIILALKDSKEEARKAAYDMLLGLSSSLGVASEAEPEGPYSRLISMILGYLSGPSPHIISAAVSALSVLVFKEPDLCLSVPDIVTSVVALLHGKAVEVIKAVLGFVKVLVSCLEAKDLQNFLSTIIDATIPWSSVSRHHFRSKVTVIMEIMLRKCGSAAVREVIPEKYQSFVRKVLQNRHGKTTSKEADSNDSSLDGNRKRTRNEATMEESDSKFLRNKRGKWRNAHDTSRGGGSGGVTRSNRKTEHPKYQKSKPGRAFGEMDKRKGRDFKRTSKRRDMERKLGRRAKENTQRPKIQNKGGKHNKFAKKH